MVSMRYIFNRRSSRSFCVISLLTVTVILLITAVSLYRKDERLRDYLKDVQNPFESQNVDEMMDSLYNVKITPITDIPVTPLELIPTYNQHIDEKRSSYWWNPIKKSSLKHFEELDLETRCKYYFRQLYTMNDKWTNDLSLMTFGIKDFKLEDIENFKDSNGNVMADEATIRMFKKRNDISLTFERMRVYDTCLMQETKVSLEKMFSEKRDSGLVENTNDEKIGSGALNNNYNLYDQYDFEHRMFPFIKQYNAKNFSRIMPKFTSPFNKVLPQGEVPLFDPKFPEVKAVTNYTYDTTESFWKNWNKMSVPGSRGIVLSFTNSHLAMALKLIATLRFQGNTLPIQVIYQDGDLSEDTIEKLIYAAKSPNVKLPETEYKDGKNTPQEIWFLDVTNTLADDWVHSFGHWKAKWLSVLFNVFDEFIFLDIDAINYVDLNEYFEREEYQKTGTIFFRDRVLNIGVGRQCTAILESLPPRLLEMKYFNNYPFIHSDYLDEDCEKNMNIEQKIYKRFFIDGRQHQMESGLFAVSKSKHQIPLVTSMMLHLAKKVGDCGWGDKEYFWLGFVVAGRPYSFDEVTAAAVGTYNKKENLDRDRQEDAGEICTIQVSHVSKEGRLLWLNGGAINCKKENAAEDDWKNEKFKSFTGQFATLEDLKYYYEVQPIDTSRAIVPFENPAYWYRKDEHCSGYAWCASHQSMLKEFSFDKRKTVGKVISFDPKEVVFTTSMNTVWSRYDTSDPKKFTKEEKNKLDPLAK